MTQGHPWIDFRGSAGWQITGGHAILFFGFRATKFFRRQKVRDQIGLVESRERADFVDDYQYVNKSRIRVNMLSSQPEATFHKNTDGETK